MFGATPIRYLSPSEEFYAQAENFIGLTLTLRGALDVGAMSEAFDTLLRVHRRMPVISSETPTADTRSWSTTTNTKASGWRRAVTSRVGDCRARPRRC